MSNIVEKWKEILETLRREHDLTDVSFNTWIKPLQIYEVKGNTITVTVPTQEMGLQLISKKYMLPLSVIIEEVTGIKFEIKLILAEDIPKRPSSAAQNANNTKIEKANLNPKYTFDTFVVGVNNNMAHAASLAVSESPGGIYNPLFIYGGVGLGKTHLMHSIAHFVLQKNPDTKVLYVTSESFTNELIEAIRNENNKAMTNFREKYRNIDVLLIDDVQFIIGKERTQEEFFHTFNDLHGSKKQIIISSDKPPKDIETLEERLRSRFEWGLTVDIKQPDYETRMAILRKKEEMDGYNIDDEIIKYIATNVKSNIRELEGALNKLIAYSNLEHKKIDMQFAESVLVDIISPDAPKEITPQLIINIVAEHFNITTADIYSHKRNQEIVYPRQIAMYLCNEMTTTPLKVIGNLIGKRDHTTVMHGAKKIAAEIENNYITSNTVDIIKKKISPN